MLEMHIKPISRIKKCNTHTHTCLCVMHDGWLWILKY
jgi:predicted restriction endonuclease